MRVVGHRNTKVTWEKIAGPRNTKLYNRIDRFNKEF